MDPEAIQYLPIDQIECAPQVRERFDEQQLIGLARSIQEIGIQQPIRARRSGDRLIVMDGERRLRASRLAKLAEVPVILEERDLGEGEVLQRQLVANIQRVDLTVCERARGIRRLIEATGWSLKETAGKCGVSNATATRLLAILDLPEVIQRRIDAGEIPESAGYLLKRIDDPAKQAALADQLAEGQLTRDGLVRKLESRGEPKRQRKRRNGQRSVAVLGAGWSVTVTGAPRTLEGFIAAMETALTKAKESRERGLELTAFIRALRDARKEA